MFRTSFFKLTLLQYVNLADRYYASTETYLRAVALRRMSPNLQTVDMLKAGRVSL